jgi:hypothetical protein
MSMLDEGLAVQIIDSQAHISLRLISRQNHESGRL